MSANKFKNPYINKLLEFPEILIEADAGIEDHKIVQILNKSINYSNIMCELGSGSGQHLIKLAQQNPSFLVVGFELRYKRAYKTAHKAAQAELNNLLIIRGAAELLPSIFKPATIDAIYINFPDPWDKRRWHKNRLFNDSNLKAWQIVLKSKAKILFKTDHQEYFNKVKSILSNNNFAIYKQTNNLYQSEYLANNIDSEFEMLFKSKNEPIYFLESILN